MKTIFSVLCTFIILSAAPRVASVEFTVLNRWGLFHNYRVLHFRVSPSSPDLAPLFRGLRAAKIPYGTYNYELSPQSGDPEEERVLGSVGVYRDQTHVTATLATQDSIGTLGSWPVSGTIEPRPKGSEPVWVILQNVYGGYREESSVDEKGNFQLPSIRGNTVIFVCAGSKVLMSALLSIKLTESVKNLDVDLRTGTVKTELR